MLCGEECSFIVTDEEIYVCGAAGVLTGLSDEAREFTPFAGRTSLPNVSTLKQIVCGKRHVLALYDDGRVFGWGENRYGQLGFASPDAVPSSRHIASLPSDVTHIAAGSLHSLATSNDGHVWSFGNSAFNELGHSEFYNQFVPKRIAALHASKIASTSAGRDFDLFSELF